MNTWPLALSVPRIWLGSWPVTRLSTTAVALGWMKWTVWLAARLKLCQLMARFWLFWTIVVVPAPVPPPAVPAVPRPALWLMLPLPALICPPLGAAWAQGVASVAPASRAAVVLRRALRRADLRRLLAISAQQIQAPVRGLRTSR